MVLRPPSTLLRRLLPFAAFFSTFTIVMLLLIMSTDFKFPHHKRNHNSSDDEDFHNAAQDNSRLVAHIRDKHLQLPTFNNHATARMSYILPQSKFVAKLFNYKKGGAFVEAGAYRRDRNSDTELLEKELGWHGLLIQPDPKDYSNLIKINRSKSYSINACLSPTPYPKEVTFRQLIRNNSGTKATFTKVNCFPLLSILLAANLTTLDYLSLDAESAEMQVMRTLPFDHVKIAMISVKWLDSENKNTLLSFMATRHYKLIKIFNNNHLFLVNKIRI